MYEGGAPFGPVISLHHIGALRRHIRLSMLSLVLRLGRDEQRKWSDGGIIPLLPGNYNTHSQYVFVSSKHIITCMKMTGCEFSTT